MNNILLDSIINYDKKGIYKLNLDKDITINVKEEDIKIYIVTKKDVKVSINIFKSTTIYNITTKNINIDINILNKSKVDFYNMAITDKNIVNTINVTHKNKKTKSNIISHGISYKSGDLKFIINGYIRKGMTDSYCTQSSRIINLDDGKSLIRPNLYIDEFDCVANHSAYTGPFDEKILFYLETKGINRKEAFKLLLNGFMKMKDLPKDYEIILEKLLNKVMRR